MHRTRAPRPGQRPPRPGTPAAPNSSRPRTAGTRFPWRGAAEEGPPHPSSGADEAVLPEPAICTEGPWRHTLRRDAEADGRFTPGRHLAWQVTAVLLWRGPVALLRVVEGLALSGDVGGRLDEAVDH